MFKFFVIILNFLFCITLQAQEISPPANHVLKVLYKAARKYNVDAQDLIKIGFVESRFKENARRLNKNGTIDFGMFQINSVHWTTTCRKFNIFTLPGNAHCAALILSLIKRDNEDDAHWIGRYHSATPSRKLEYSRKLMSVTIKEK